MTGDAVKTLLSKKDIDSFRKYLDTSKIPFKSKIYDSIGVLENIDFDKISVCYDDLIYEFELVFFNVNEKDSGSMIVIVRESNSKIYIHGCKFLTEDLKINDNALPELLKFILEGRYTIISEIYKGRVVSLTVEFMNVKSTIRFGLFNVFWRKTTIKNEKGKNYLLL
jgi:hypothetical protein